MGGKYFMQQLIYLYTFLVYNWLDAIVQFTLYLEYLEVNGTLIAWEQAWCII